MGAALIHTKNGETGNMNQLRASSCYEFANKILMLQRRQFSNEYIAGAWLRWVLKKRSVCCMQLEFL